MVGGGPRPQEATSRFVEWAGKEKARILIICWATEAPHEAFNSLNETFRPFRPQTIEPAPPAPLTAVTKFRFLSQLHAATGVFFSGGDQARIMDVLKDESLLQALRIRYVGGMVFGGTSAGTAIMSHRMITGEGDFKVIDGSKVVTRVGMGLLPPRIIIDQHFIKRQRENRLFALILQGPEDFGLGVDEGTALLVKDNRIGEVVGASQVMLVVSPARKDSLIIQLARQGDRIDLLKRKVIKKMGVKTASRNPK